MKKAGFANVFEFNDIEAWKKNGLELAENNTLSTHGCVQALADRL